MPTYAYACKECGHAFDIFQSFSEDALTECPQCSGLLRKKFGNVGVTFKGSGFYRTDSRKSSNSTPASSSTSSNGSSESKGSSGSDGAKGSDSASSTKASSTKESSSTSSS
ncbi:FmdB family zinc ribbon protein [Garicola koreensis]|uniref:Putative FmdB family regulatory protein n=1 Tax=Garicola koreensis TaxID=1262554 RepID=A0A7W5XYH9_9MICC|nr:FmdB family zinc ribbon protein [Garicola koreensis]MBB3666516.1 putative FmdB family regulatory protein [Garicola koreensis]